MLIKLEQNAIILLFIKYLSPVDSCKYLDRIRDLNKN